MEAAAYLGLLRRRFAPLALCCLAGLAGALMVVRNTPETYRASTRLIINIPAAREVQEALQGFQLSSQLLASYSRVATSRSTAERVVRDLELDINPSDLQGRIAADPVPDTLLLDISATAGSPEASKRTANAAARAFIATVADLESGTNDSIRPRVIDSAQLPSRPESPRPARDITAGLAVGLLLGLALALLLESLDRTVRLPGEVAQLAGAPLMAAVPKRRDASRRPVLGPDDTGTPAAESYRVLRTAIRFMDLETPIRSLVVTSPSAGEGKTSTAANLAVALAQGGERVILVDADLRRSRLAEVLSYESEVGLTSVLVRTATLDDALVDLTERLTVLPTGPLPPNPSELLGSESMARVISDLATRCDLVIFDTAPLLPVADAQVLSTQADAVLLVARFGRTPREQLAEARRRLDVVGSRTVGALLNGVPPSAEYSDEYSYYARQPSGRRRPRLPWSPLARPLSGGVEARGGGDPPSRRGPEPVEQGSNPDLRRA